MRHNMTVLLSCFYLCKYYMCLQPCIRTHIIGHGIKRLLKKYDNAIYWPSMQADIYPERLSIMMHNLFSNKVTQNYDRLKRVWFFSF